MRDPGERHISCGLFRFVVRGHGERHISCDIVRFVLNGALGRGTYVVTLLCLF